MEFPKYPLKGQVETDVRSGCISNGKGPKYLPKLPTFVGGHTDFMIGVKYLRYFPEKVFQLPSGLAINKSWFKNAVGTRGVIGYPHRVFTETETSHQVNVRSFLTDQYKRFKSEFQVNPHALMLHVRFKKNHLNDVVVKTYQVNYVDEAKTTQSLLVRKQKMFEDVENAGSEINYRCSICRNCKVCKEQSTDEIMSVKEEVEQDVINKSVKVDVDSQGTTASLPLMNNPSIKLAHNKERAMKVYNKQIKKLNQNTDDVVESEEKPQQLGYVDYVRNLKPEQQEMLRRSEIQNFIPWRAMWNGNSISTPCRLAFDVSQSTASGWSLNDILAKGENNMNKLVEIAMRWSIYKIGYHTDIKEMYNSVKLVEDD